MSLLLNFRLCYNGLSLCCRMLATLSAKSLWI